MAVLFSAGGLDLSEFMRKKNNKPKIADSEFAKMNVTIPAQRVFRFAFNPNNFLWEKGNYGGLERPNYRYTPFLKDQASMPKWMKYKYSQRHKAGESIMIR